MGRQLNANELKSYETDFANATFVSMIKNGERDRNTGHPTMDEAPEMEANPLMPETPTNARSYTAHATYANNFQRNEP